MTRPYLSAPYTPPFSQKLIVGILASTALITPVAYAQQAVWTGVTSSDYLDGTNWSTGIVPDSSNDVLINTQSPNPAQIAVPSGNYVSLNVNSLGIGNGPGADGRLSISFADDQSNGFYLIPTTQQITVGGNSGRGQLDANLPTQTVGGYGGSVNFGQSELIIGDGAGSQGAFNILQTGKNRYLISDSSAMRVTSGTAIVGNSGGNGIATVSGGWDVQGTPNVGYDGLHVGVGTGSTGVVNVLSGGKVTYSSYMPAVQNMSSQLKGFVIGEAGGTGIMNVSGTNTTDPIAPPSTMQTGLGLTVGIGAGSTGQLNIRDGAVGMSYSIDASNSYQVPPAQVGVDGGVGSIFVSGTGSTLTIAGINGYNIGQAESTTGDLYVGLSGGTGSLTIANDAVVTIGTEFMSIQGPYSNYTWTPGEGSGILYLAKDAGSTGTLAIGAPAGQAPQAPGTLNVAGVVLGQGTGAIVFNHTSTGLQFDTPISGQGEIDVYNGTTAIATDNSAGFTHTRRVYDPFGSGLTTVDETFTNGFSGQTNMYGGTLVLQNNFAIGTSQVVGIGNATLGYGLDGLSIANPITVNAGATLSLLTDAGVSATQTGEIDGVGNISKTGAGTLILTADNTIAGQVIITDGTLRAGATNTFSPNADHIVAGAGTLDMNGLNQTVRSLTNAGLVRTGGAPGTILTVSGNYIGNGGILALNTTLGDSTSPTDKMVVHGNTSGSTGLLITNINGQGAQTTGNGIQVVQVDGQSSGSFALVSRAVAGVYEYKLYQATDGDWYLSTGGLRPEVGAYVGNRHAATSMFVHTLHDRLGAQIDGQSAWVRVTGNHIDSTAASGRVDLKTDNGQVHFGADLARQGGWRVGLMGGYGYSRTDASAQGNLTTWSGQSNFAKGTVDGYGLGMYVTWLGQTDGVGPYVDTWLQSGWYHNRVSARDLRSESYSSNSVTGSIEGGYAFAIGQYGNRQWLVEPQAQLLYTNYTSDDILEQNGTRITAQSSNDVSTRLGARLSGRPAEAGAILPFVEVNWWHGTADNGMLFNGALADADTPDNRAELKVGLQGNIAKDWQIWGHVGGQWGDHSYSRYEGMIGIKRNF